MTFASRTDVPVDRTQTQIKSLVMTNGGIAYGQAEDATRGMIWFEMRKRQVKFILPLPSREQLTKERKRSVSESQHAQEMRRRWRALFLVIKAKLEAVASGIRSFDIEFAADIVASDGKTVGEWLAPQINQMYSTGKMPPLLPGLGESTS